MLLFSNSNNNLNYSHLPEQFLTTSSQLSETEQSGDNSANTSVELTDGDFTNSDHENNNHQEEANQADIESF